MSPHLTSSPLASSHPLRLFSSASRQYVLPHHSERVAAAELLVNDEAAAIPLPTGKALLGPYLVFLCSTVNG